MLKMCTSQIYQKYTLVGLMQRVSKYNLLIANLHIKYFFLKHV